MWRTILILAVVIAAVLAEDDAQNSTSLSDEEEKDEVDENISRGGENLENKHVEIDLENLSRKKVKIKKKYKKYLKEMLMVGILVKSALLPLAIGFLKLLTGKALMVTLMALGLITALTFRSASDKGTTTEIINLVPHHKHHRSFNSNISNDQVWQYLISGSYENRRS